jgi:hypothetical protein
MSLVKEIVKPRVMTSLPRDIVNNVEVCNKRFLGVNKSIIVEHLNCCGKLHMFYPADEEFLKDIREPRFLVNELRLYTVTNTVLIQVSDKIINLYKGGSETDIHGKECARLLFTLPAHNAALIEAEFLTFKFVLPPHSTPEFISCISLEIQHYHQKQCSLIIEAPIFPRVLRRVSLFREFIVYFIVSSKSLFGFSLDKNHVFSEEP